MIHALIIFAFLFILIIIGLFAIISARKQRTEFAKTGKYPAGHFINKGMFTGISMGTGLGLPIGFSIGFDGFFIVGLLIGLAIGAAMGVSWEKQEKSRIRPLNNEQKNRRNLKVYFGLIVILAISWLTLHLLR